MGVKRYRVGERIRTVVWRKPGVFKGEDSTSLVMEEAGWIVSVEEWKRVYSDDYKWRRVHWDIVREGDRLPTPRWWERIFRFRRFRAYRAPLPKARLLQP